MLLNALEEQETRLMEKLRVSSDLSFQRFEKAKSAKDDILDC